MNRLDFKKINSQDGITLFVTLVLMGVLLGVSASLLNITLKQHQLSGVSYASEVAFQAANAGMECAMYYDLINNEFDVPGDGSSLGAPSSMTCMGDSSSGDSGGLVQNGKEQWHMFNWGGVCTEFSVYKFFNASSDEAVEIVPGEPLRADCPTGSECTVIKSRGYNVACGAIDSGVRVVEREYTQVY